MKVTLIEGCPYAYRRFSYYSIRAFDAAEAEENTPVDPEVEHQERELILKNIQKNLHLCP